MRLVSQGRGGSLLREFEYPLADLLSLPSSAPPKQKN